jgi:transposase
MAERRTYIGLDVAKEWLDLAQWPDGTSWRIPNTPRGWTTLIGDLGQLTNPLVVLEATGPYHLGVVIALADAGYASAVINPAHIRHFARSQGKRAKTDRADAKLIAQYGGQTTPAATPLPSATERTLRTLVNRREDLTKDRVRERNRLKTATEPFVRASIERHLAMIAAEHKEIDQEMVRLIATDREITTRTRLIDTAPGIGSVLAATIIAGLPELGHARSKQLAALVGVAPFAHDSGKKTGQRSISGGRASVRKALYQAVTTGLRCNPALRTHVTKLKDAGKPHKTAMVAAMRRLLGILNAMLRDGLTWQETAVGQGRFLDPTA